MQSRNLKLCSQMNKIFKIFGWELGIRQKRASAEVCPLPQGQRGQEGQEGQTLCIPCCFLNHWLLERIRQSPEG